MLKLLAIVFIVFSVNACDHFYWGQREKETLKKEHPTIRVVTINTPLTFQNNSFFYNSLESDLILSLSKEFDLNVKWKVVRNASEAIRFVQNGGADIAAVRSTSDWRANDLSFSKPYQKSSLDVVCKDTRSPREILVLDRNYSLKTSKLVARNFPNARLRIVPAERASDLFKRVEKQDTSCALAEHYESQYFLRLFPSLKTVKQLDGDHFVQFIYTKKSPALEKMFQLWYTESQKSGELREIKLRHLSHLNALDRSDLKTFYTALNKDLYKYKHLFAEIAKDFSLPWQILAAISFQESHWNPDARSFTGVRGLMQLTQGASEHMGISDRTDPEQAVYGGAKFFVFLYKRTPASLPVKERLTLALASYNVGIGHLKDAQDLCEKEGLNPWAWADVRKMLPRLSDPDIAEETKWGVARGQEPVDFAERVRSYFEIMTTKI